jgi:multiple sugar transport system substrate-binding protein
MIIKNLTKIQILPYTSYPLRNFKDTFVDASSVFLRSEGIVAVPYIIDPMIMFWNKTHYVNAGIINPPVRWDEFTSNVTKLTKKDSNSNISQSGVALGEYQNVLHAKDILSMFFLQAGAPIVGMNSNDSYFTSLSNLGEKVSDENLSSAALSFYTDFANPSKGTYAWNKSFKSSIDSFVSGETSTYFGFPSEIPAISLKNPNLNFDVAMVPQVSGSEKKSTYAKVYGLAVLKSSKKQASAFNQIFTLTSQNSIKELSAITNLPPIRRDVLAEKATNPYLQYAYDSALIADSWVDPDRAGTESAFKNMIEYVIVGKITASAAVGNAETEITKLIKGIENK